MVTMGKFMSLVIEFFEDERKKTGSKNYRAACEQIEKPLLELFLMQKVISRRGLRLEKQDEGMIYYFGPKFRTTFRELNSIFIEKLIGRFEHEVSMVRTNRSEMLIRKDENHEKTRADYLYACEQLIGKLNNLLGTRAEELNYFVNIGHRLGPFGFKIRRTDLK